MSLQHINDGGMVLDTYYTTPPVEDDVLNSTLEIVEEMSDSSTTGKPTMKPTAVVGTNGPTTMAGGGVAGAEAASSGAIIGVSNMILVGGCIYLSWLF